MSKLLFEIENHRGDGIACMSESKLKTCFKRHTGCTVTEYFQRQRMSQAEHLLIDTDLTMGQIAQMIGCTTSGRFAELFRKRMGIPPIEYRKIAEDPTSEFHLAFNRIVYVELPLLEILNKLRFTDRADKSAP